MSRIIYGIHPVLEILRSHPEKVEKILSSRDLSGKQNKRSGTSAQKISISFKEIIKLSDRWGIRLFPEKKERLEQVVGQVNHQGIAAYVSEFGYSSLEEIVGHWRNSNEKAFILILDGLQDTQNLGAIVRSAEGAGIHGIIIPKDRAAGVTSTVEKVSAGALEYVSIARVTNISQTIEKLKKAGIWVVGTEGDGGTSLYDADFDADIAVVIGSEGKGIRPLVKKKCDYLISIPMRGKINSLNASVSAAIVIYEIVRQRSL